MGRYPKIFDRLYRAMVRSGEQSGRLDEAMDRIAYQVEKADALRREVKSALMYPALIFGFAAVVLIAIVAFVIPVFAKLFEELAEENPAEATGLPAPTQFCVSLSNAITGYWFVLIPGLILSVFLFFKWKKTEAGHRAWDRFTLKDSLQIGDVVQKVALARWSRTFSGAVSSGVPMLQAIQLTGETAGNVVVEDSMDEGLCLGQARRLDRRADRRGGDLPADGRPPWSRWARKLVSSTEMLSKVADFYEAEVDAKVKALTALLEPVMIVFVGGMVGFIVISMYLPMFSIYEHIR